MERSNIKRAPVESRQTSLEDLSTAQDEKALITITTTKAAPGRLEHCMQLQIALQRQPASGHGAVNGTSLASSALYFLTEIFLYVALPISTPRL